MDTVYDIIINWHHGYANSPSATIVVPAKIYDHFGYDRRVWWQTHDERYCYATKDNILYHFIAARNTGILPRKHMMGFAGHVFHLRLYDGDDVITNDAWSGNARDFMGSLPIAGTLADVSIVNGDAPTSSRQAWAGFAIRKDELTNLVENAGYHMTPQGIISTDHMTPMKPEELI